MLAPEVAVADLTAFGEGVVVVFEAMGGAVVGYADEEGSSIVGVGEAGDGCTPLTAAMDRLRGTTRTPSLYTTRMDSHSVTATRLTLVLVEGTEKRLGLAPLA